MVEEEEGLRQCLTLCLEGSKDEALECLDLNPEFLNRALYNSGFDRADMRRSRLPFLCMGDVALTAASKGGNAELVEELLTRGADLNALESLSFDAFMLACEFNRVAVAEVLVGHRAATIADLEMAARNDSLPICLLLIARSVDLKASDALEKYGSTLWPELTPDELEQRRTTLRTAFEQVRADACWTRRWPMMSVMAGCEFRPLAVRLLEREMHLAALLASGEVAPPPAPIALDTPQQRRAYYMLLIFRSDFLLRRIVLFL